MVTRDPIIEQGERDHRLVRELAAQAEARFSELLPLLGDALSAVHR